MIYVIFWLSLLIFLLCMHAVSDVNKILVSLTLGYTSLQFLVIFYTYTHTCLIIYIDVLRVFILVPFHCAPLKFRSRVRHHRCIFAEFSKEIYIFKKYGIYKIIFKNHVTDVTLQTNSENLVSKPSLLRKRSESFLVLFPQRTV